MADERDRMKAKLAYLTSPSPGVFVLNFQIGEDGDCQRVEISRGHLANILIDGTAPALRENCFHRVPETIRHESADNERAGR